MAALLSPLVASSPLMLRGWNNPKCAWRGVADGGHWCRVKLLQGCCGLKLLAVLENFVFGLIAPHHGPLPEGRIPLLLVGPEIATEVALRDVFRRLQRAHRLIVEAVR